MDDIQNIDPDLLTRLKFYGIGLVPTLLGHLIYSGNSHTPPWSFLVIVVILLVGIIWTVLDLFHANRWMRLSGHIIGFTVNVLIVALMLA
ncbi:MAG: hypothetical protein KF905_08920 [Flavobacteriales bacterium]|nr:hypothetical protein [Flavobacteriales bacterium]